MTREEIKAGFKFTVDMFKFDPLTGEERALNEHDATTVNACEEAIKVLEQEPNTWSLDDAREDFMHDVYNTLDFLPTNDEANRIIDSFDRVTSSIKQEPRWVPVTERLPKEYVCDDGFIEPSEPVLVQLNNKEMKVSRYWGSREHYKDKPWIDLSYPTTLEVVAWKPLPEPYRAESEDG